MLMPMQAVNYYHYCSGTEGGSSSTVILGATITVGVILLLLLASAMALAFVAVARRRRRRRQPEDARELPEAQFELDDN